MSRARKSFTKDTIILRNIQLHKCLHISNCLRQPIDKKDIHKHKKEHIETRREITFTKVKICYSSIQK